MRTKDRVEWGKGHMVQDGSSKEQHNKVGKIRLEGGELRGMHFWVYVCVYHSNPAIANDTKFMPRVPIVDNQGGQDGEETQAVPSPAPASPPLSVPPPLLPLTPAVAGELLK